MLYYVEVLRMNADYDHAQGCWRGRGEQEAALILA